MSKKPVNPWDLKEYKRYTLQSHIPYELVPPISGEFIGIVGKIPIISDRPSNTRGFNVNPKYHIFSENTKNISANNLVIGKTYKVVAKNPMVLPFNAVFLGYNYKLKFRNKEIFPDVFVPDPFIIDSNKTTIYELPSDAIHGLHRLSSSPSPPNSSPTNLKNSNKVNVFKVTTTTSKTRRSRSSQHRTKSSRSRKYI